MKVTVTYPLNKRKGQPATLPGNKMGTLKIGDTIEVASVEEGQYIEGNNTWLKDTEGFYYWSGATNYKILSGTVSPVSGEAETDFYSQVNGLFGSVTGLKPFAGSKGEGITIAALDSGINPHDALKEVLLPVAINCVTDETGTNDIGGHGTQVSGIIAAGNSVLRGIAPAAKLINIRVLDKSNGSSRKDLKKGLTEVLKLIQSGQKIDIVNMSLYVGYKNENPAQKSDIEEIDSLLKQLADSGVILVAAAGDDAEIKPGMPNPKFPAGSTHCISAGTLAAGNTAQIVNPAINYVFISNSIKSVTNNNQYGNFNFSSAYTAVVSAFCAKILSQKKTSKNDIIALLNQLPQSTLNSIFKPIQPNYQLS